MVAQIVAAWQPDCEKMERKWRENEEMKEIHSLHFLILSLFPPSLSISYIKIVTFCREMLNTANSLRGSSASCAGLGKRQRHLNRQEKKTEITSEPDWHFTCVGQGTQILRCMIS